MKFEIAKQEQKKEDSPVVLDLEESGDGVILTAMKDGKRLQVNVLTVCTDGTVYMHTAVNPDLGFQLTDGGQVVVVR